MCAQMEKRSLLEAETIRPFCGIWSKSSRWLNLPMVANGYRDYLRYSAGVSEGDRSLCAGMKWRGLQTGDGETRGRLLVRALLLVPLSPGLLPYKGFCQKYKPKSKPEKSYSWESRLLPLVLKVRDKKKRAPGQMRLPWDEWEATNSEIREVAEKFVMANCYDPKVAAQFFNDSWIF